jgi:tetratricopeptide (TPR) repeat protein
MSKNLDTLRRQAVELYEKEKFKEIIELLNDEILEKYKDAELYAWRARAHYMLDDDANIIMQYSQKAIDSDGNYYMAFYVRGFAWDEKSEYDKAIADYTKAIELKPDDGSIYNNRGISWKSKGEYDKAIADYTKAIELKPSYAGAYSNRGISWKNKNEYDKAIADYTKAIELRPGYAAAYLNRGLVWSDKDEYEKALQDYTKAIELKPDYVIAYNNRGTVLNHKAEYDKAIVDFMKAIELKPDYANAYYNMGIAKRNVGKNLNESISDFEKYLDIAPIKDDVWATKARDFIQELQEKIKDNKLKEISDLVSEIKKILLITDGCITHYTGLSIGKILVLDEKSKFRLSEGAFLNDTSEGTELFRFLNYKFSTQQEDGLIARSFTPKPFIGSFVAEDKHDDLNLWRFYGKENNVEAKGCALTLKMKEFIDEINESLTHGTDMPFIASEDDINFYRVAYLDHNSTTISFQIPNAMKDEKKLNKLLKDLKDKVDDYKTEDKSILEKYLNSIAFLFKSDVYKNENELRLVMKGIEFEKKIDIDANPPRVYIELINIRHLIEQITLGPKVDKPDEWAAALHYSYAKETDENKRPKKILVSRLPYK